MGGGDEEKSVMWVGDNVVGGLLLRHNTTCQFERSSYQAVW